MYQDSKTASNFTRTVPLTGILPHLAPLSCRKGLDMTAVEELSGHILRDRRALDLFRLLKGVRKQRTLRLSFERLLEKSGMIGCSGLDHVQIVELAKRHDLVWKLNAVIRRLLDWYGLEEVAGLK